MAMELEGDREGRFLAVVEDPLTMVVLRERLMGGEKIEAVASSWSVAPGRLMRWVSEDAGRYAEYLRAIEVGAHRLVDEAIGIADGHKSEETLPTNHRGDYYDPMLNRDRLRVESRLRVAAAHNRAVYGEAKVEGGQKNSITVVVDRGGAVPAASGSGVSGLVIDGEVEV